MKGDEDMEQQEIEEYEEFQDSPWATGASMPHFDWYGDGPWAATGNWHPPDPDVKDEPQEAIRIEPLRQGFLVKCRCVAERAFTDRVDAAEWLLGWLGFEDEIAESALDILVEPDAHEPNDWCLDEYKRALAVVGAAQAYVAAPESNAANPYEYDKLVEAVRKWRGTIK